MVFRQKRQRRNNTSNLDFEIDKLEPRLLLAAEVRLSGDNLRIIGDNSADDVSVYWNDTTSTIWVDNGASAEDTFLASIKNLTILTKDSGGLADQVHVDNRVQVTSKTTIKLGSGTNQLNLGGLHRNLRVIGGSGDDQVVLEGGFGTARNTISLKSGQDSITIVADAYEQAANDDTPLANYLDTLPSDITLLTSLPKLKANLGSGDDSFSVTYGGEVMSEPQLLGFIDALGFGTYASIDDAVSQLEVAADAAGIRVPNLIRLNGGRDVDLITPGALGDLIDFIGSHKAFELFSDPPIIVAALANDTAAFGGTNDDGLTFDATITGQVLGNLGSGSQLTVSIDDGAETVLPVEIDGAFTFDPGLATDGSDDGVYLAQFVVTDSNGISRSTEVAFTLDTVGPTAATLELNEDSDTGTIGDNQTNLDLVTLQGVAEIGTVGLLVQEGLPIGVEANGEFEIAGVPLDIGPNVIQADFFDVAGNSTRSELVVDREAPSGATILSEAGGFATEASLAIVVGQDEGSRTLRFKLDRNFDLSDSSAAIEDLFSIYVVDAADPTQTILDRGENGTSIFSLAGEDVEYVPGLVQFDGDYVSIDLTSLGDLSTASLLLQLINHDTDNGTVVAVSELTNEVDLEGVARPTLIMPPNVSAAGDMLDYEALAMTSDVVATLTNVRFDSSTGLYTAELSLEASAENHGRTIAVVFPGLPAGVQLLNPSGTNANGDPYLNLSSQTPSGGLRPNFSTGKVLVEFANPTGIPFVIETEVIVGAPNQTPTIAPVTPITLFPGDALEVPLDVTDADGDVVTLTIDADGPMPTTTLRADQTLVFEPRPDEIGTYLFQVIASDGAASSSQTIEVTVVADPVTTTRLSGVILNTDEQPLANIPIELGSFQTTTDSQGRYTLDFGSFVPGPDDALIVRGEAFVGSETYPFIAEKLHLLTEEVFAGQNNVLLRPIYLPALDVANGVTINPAVDTTVSVALVPGEAEAEVFVEAGTLLDQSGNPFTGILSITEVPADLTPAALPLEFLPDTVVTIQPGEMNFTAPAALTLPNRAGLDPGTEFDLWSINPVTGQFDDVGRGRVSADGSVIETIEGGILNSSWHFFALEVINIELTVTNDFNQDIVCEPCQEMLPGTSMVEAHSGAVIESHNLVTYESLGETRGVQLVYNSLRADTRPIIHDVFSLNLTAPGGNFGQVRLVSSLTVGNGTISMEVPGGSLGSNAPNNAHFWRPSLGGLQNIALQADMNGLATGRYEYTMNSGFVVLQGNTITGSSGVRGSSTGTIVHVNSADSVFGSGWEIAGLQYLVENGDGSVLLVDGDGSEAMYELLSDGSYDSPPGHFSTLTKLGNGQFQHTTIDQTVSSFDANNRLSTVVDRNNNTTTYAYNTDGQIATITDAVGLVTTFNYTNGKVSSIVDPADRVTQFEYDTNGNLTRVTDPDGTFRTWEYDELHHIVAEVDKRGFREEMEYDFAGRALKATRKDGSVLQYNPVQVQGLAPAVVTSNLNTAPSSSRIVETTASFVDGNGEVSIIALNRAGQRLSSDDAIGNTGSLTYNDEILLTSSIDARGFRTDYVYDAFGNLITVQDSISSGGGAGGVDYGAPAILRNATILGDVNGDGLDDLISTLGQILLNNGAGGFTDGEELDYGGGAELNATMYEVADMNGDGVMDIVGSAGVDQGLSSGNLWVWIGNLDGTYDVADSYDTNLLQGGDAEEIRLPGFVVADFNGDSRPDVLLTQNRDEFGEPFTAFIEYLNTGTGFLSNPNIILPDDSDFNNVIPFPNATEAADLNGDGVLDLIITNTRDSLSSGNHVLSVMLGGGPTGYQSPANYNLGFSFTGTILPELEKAAIELTDFNNDGNLDAVVASTNAGVVSVVLGNGLEGFGAPNIIATGTVTGDTTFIWNAIETADFNGDGNQDIAATSYDQKTISVMLGNGFGAFSPRQDYRYDTPDDFDAVFESDRADGLFAIDMNADGILDLATPSANGHDFSYLRGVGDGTFVSWQQIDLVPVEDFAPQQVETYDLDGDGNLDIVTRTAETGVEVRFGLGNRQFTNAVLLSAPSDFSRSMVLVDSNNDGNKDIVLGHFSSSSRVEYSLFENNGDRTFSTAIDLGFGATSFGFLTVGDFNNDSIDDLATVSQGLPLGSDNQLKILLGDGASGYSESTIALTDIPFDVVAGDINNDGNDDILVDYFGNNDFSTLLGDGSGGFAVESTYSSTLQDHLQLADLNNDGFLDLAYVGFDDATMVLDGVYRLNDGSGGFGPETFVGIGTTARRFVQDDAEHLSVGDVNGDGLVDLVVSSATHFHVVAGIAGGGFGAVTSFRGGGLAPAIADVDNDGVVDIIGIRSTRAGSDHNENAITFHYGLTESGATPVRFTYDPVFNQLTSVTDELGRQTLYEIDEANGDTLSMTRVIGQLDSTSGETDDLVTTYSYTTAGLVAQVTDPLGRITEFEYDSLGRNTRIVLALGTTDEASMTFGYDAAGNVIEFVDSNSNLSTFQYDTLNRQVVLTDPLLAIATLEYDTDGRLIGSVDRTGSETSYVYDALGRMTLATDEQLNTTQFEYDEYGNNTRVIDPLGQAMRYVYDARDRVTQVMDPDGGVTQLAYDADNNLTRLIDSAGNLTRFSYDARNRQTSEFDPLNQEIQYEYDLVDNLISETDRNGRTAEFVYDDVDRLVSETWIEANSSIANTIEYTYGKTSKLLSVVDDFSALTWTYDARDRAITESNTGTLGTPEVLLEYTYDAVGNVLSITDTIEGVAGAVTSYRYDALNRMESISQTGAGGFAVADKRVDIAYNEIGQFALITRYSDLAGTQLVIDTTYVYDSLNRLERLAHDSSAGNVAFYNFVYDEDSRITRITDVDGATDYTYDNRDQLTAADHEDGSKPDESYAYDANGNRIESHLHAGDYVTGPANRLESDGVYEYEYDHEGNRILQTEIASGEYREFVYDHRNRLIAVFDYSSGGIELQGVEFVYDAIGRRISKSVDGSLVYFVYNGDDVLLDFVDADGLGGLDPTLTQRYLHGPGVDETLVQEASTGEVLWLLTDQLGTTRDLVDAAGQLANHIKYDSFGAVISESGATSNTRYLFTGREYDAELELMYYRARFYDASVGRFLSEDGLRFADGSNLSRYVNNAVTDHIDPFGNLGLSIGKAGGGLLRSILGGGGCQLDKDKDEPWFMAGDEPKSSMAAGLSDLIKTTVGQGGALLDGVGDVMRQLPQIGVGTPTSDGGILSGMGSVLGGGASSANKGPGRTAGILGSLGGGSKSGGGIASGLGGVTAGLSGGKFSGGSSTNSGGLGGLLGGGNRVGRGGLGLGGVHLPPGLFKSNLPTFRHLVAQAGPLTNQLGHLLNTMLGPK